MTAGRDTVSDARDPLDEAVKRYVARFGEGPSVWQFMAWPAELAREIDAAAARGERLTATDLYRRLGVEPPPPDAIL
jgi:hypothetical protein